MKTNKKKVLVVSLAVSLVAILSLGSLAWFSDSDEVTNQFMIATSEDTEPDDIFSVDVWENTPDGEKDQDGYTYEDVLPGDVLKKEAMVENTGYYDQYVRVTVTVSDAAAWMAALKTNGAVPKLEQIVNGFDRNVNIWHIASEKVVNDTLVYTMYLNGVLEGDIENNYDYRPDVVTVFTEVKIPESLTVDQAAAFESNFKINVKAEAVQTENLGLDLSKGDGAEEAFAKVGI